MPETENIFADSYKRTPWYTRLWARVLLLIILLILLFGILFIVMTASYVRKIKRGEVIGGFTRSSLVQKEQSSEPADPALLFKADDPLIGPSDALLTIAEFGDFECSFSKEAFSHVRSFQAMHPNEVRLVWRDYPLSDVHPRALVLADAAACAHEQGKFWAFHDKLFANHGRFSDEDLVSYLKQVGLDNSLFARCLESGRVHQGIIKDTEDAIALGVIGTPTFFANGFRFSGVVPSDIWEKILSQIQKQKGG